MSTELIILFALQGLIFFILVGLIIQLRGKNQPTEALATELSGEFQRLREEQVRLENQIESSFSRDREERAQHSKQLREELSGAIFRAIDATQNLQMKSIEGLGKLQAEQLKSFAEQLFALQNNLDGNAQSLREETQNRFTAFLQAQQTFMADFSTKLSQQSETLQTLGERLRGALEQQLEGLQKSNADKLEQMRQTVDEKLQGTLEKRLGESFKIVSERLEAVHQGLGDMRQLAQGVGDLKKVLSNVKTRGGWGELQLATILEEMLTPDQYDKNVAVKPGSNDRVEFAIRLPGQSDGTFRGVYAGSSDQPCVWLPLDAKFPREDYERLVDSMEKGDTNGIEQAGKALEIRIRAEAKSIRDKYIAPPATTDFAILFLPTEGLYAEVLRRAGLADDVQRDYRVVIAGPTTLSALINALQMGFRTLAIEKRSSEVWKTLGEVKSGFNRFGDLLDKVKKKIDEAGNTIDKAAQSSRSIERKLRSVEALPTSENDLFSLEKPQPPTETE